MFLQAQLELEDNMDAQVIRICPCGFLSMRCAETVKPYRTPLNPTP